MLRANEVDLALTTHRLESFESIALRTSPTLWYCAADYILPPGEALPLVLLDEPSPFRDVIVGTLNAANIPWRVTYIASTLSAVRAAVKAGLGITARPVEMMSPELRVLGAKEGLPQLPDTEYLLSRNEHNSSELVQSIFQSVESYQNPWAQYGVFQSEAVNENSFIERDLD